MSRDPFVLDVGNVLGVAGVRHRYSLDGCLPGAALPAVAVPEDAEVHVELVLEAQGGDIIAEGTLSAEWQGECRRCLEQTTGTVEVGFREIYSDDPVEGETFPLAGERVDLRPMLREALTLALPLAPLCRDACRGPAPEEHPVVPSGGQDEEATPPGDDRWAVLDQLRLD